MEFDLTLYSEEAIHRAIQAFAEIASIDGSRKGEKYLCRICSSKLDPELTGLEFANYVLDMTLMMEGNS